MKFVGHYGVVPDALINSDRLSLADKVVFVALVHFANEQGQCWPSVHALAEFAHVGDRTVQRSTKDLQAEHYITVKRTSHVKSCFYQLSEPDVRQPATYETGQQEMMLPEATKSANLTPVEVEVVTSANVTPSSTPTWHPSMANVAPELILNELPSVDLKKEKEKEREISLSQNRQEDKRQHGSIFDEPGPPNADWTCRYVANRWDIGSEPTAWLRRRHPEVNVDSIIEQTEVQLQANGGKPIRHGLSYLDYCCEHVFERVATSWEDTAEFIAQRWRRGQKAKRRVMKPGGKT